MHPCVSSSLKIVTHFWLLTVFLELVTLFGPIRRLLQLSCLPRLKGWKKASVHWFGIPGLGMASATVKVLKEGEFHVLLLFALSGFILYCLKIWLSLDFLWNLVSGWMHKISGALFILCSGIKKEWSYLFLVIFWNAHLLAQRCSLVGESSVSRRWGGHLQIDSHGCFKGLYLDLLRHEGTLLHCNHFVGWPKAGCRLRWQKLGGHTNSLLNRSPFPSGMINQRMNCSQDTPCAGSVILSSCLGK